MDITADLNDEDDTGYVWTFLDEARDPGQIKPGAIIVAGVAITAAASASSARSVHDTGPSAGVAMTPVSRQGPSSQSRLCA